MDGELVSKIKRCASQLKPIHGETASGSSKTIIVHLITLVILKLVRAPKHVLVSKIRPNMSQFKLLHGETANGPLIQLTLFDNFGHARANTCTQTCASLKT